MGVEDQVESASSEPAEHAPEPALAADRDSSTLRRPALWLALIAIVLALMVLQDLVRNAFG